MNFITKINTKTAGFKTIGGIVIMVGASILKVRGLVDEQLYAELFSIGTTLALYGRYYAGKTTKKS